MSTKQFMTNAAARHAVFVQRFGGGQARKALVYVDKLRKQLATRIASEDLTNISAARLKAMYNDLTDLTQSLYEKMGKDVQKDMKKFAKYEAEFTGKMAKQGIDVEQFAIPSTETLEEAINTKVMEFAPGQGSATIGDALSNFKAAKAKQIVQTIKDGTVLGRTSAEIIQDMSHVVGNIQRHNAEALVRTITNHVSTVARMTTLKENADVLEGYEVVATLDAQTTLICAGLDGKVFDIDEVEYPPYHWNCRTTLIPRVKKEFDLGAEVTGERPAVGQDGAQDGVSANKKFGGWLMDQPKEFKEAYFSKFSDGEEKFQLFNSGQLKIDQFTDAKGAELTLDELRSLADVALKK